MTVNDLKTQKLLDSLHINSDHILTEEIWERIQNLRKAVLENKNHPSPVTTSLILAEDENVVKDINEWFEKIDDHSGNQFINNETAFFNQLLRCGFAIKLKELIGKHEEIIYDKLVQIGFIGLDNIPKSPNYTHLVFNKSVYKWQELDNADLHNKVGLGSLEVISFEQFIDFINYLHSNNLAGVFVLSHNATMSFKKNDTAKIEPNLSQFQVPLKIDEAIKLLKSNGYRVLRGKTKWKEV